VEGLLIDEKNYWLAPWGLGGRVLWKEWDGEERKFAADIVSNTCEA